MEKYIFTDLACEVAKEKQENFQKISEGIIRLSFFDDSKLVGEMCTTFFTSKLWLLTDEEFFLLSDAVANELRRMLSRVLDREGMVRVLVVGLGNPRVSADSLGANTVDGVYIGAHNKSKNFFVMAVAPDVSENTGIKTLDTVKAYVDSASADAIVVVDSLRARCVERLAATVQLSEGGIKPGSGVGGNGAELSLATLGIPVISVGIPTVVSSATLIYDVVSRCAKATDIELEDLLENNMSFLVAPREIDLLIKSGSLLLSNAINRAFS